jgi:hypothetical protein
LTNLKYNESINPIPKAGEPIMIKVKPEHEDDIFPIREFVCRLGKVMDEQFDKLYVKLVADGFPEDESTKSWLFDYLFNSDCDKEVVSFEEYMDSEFMIEYRQKKANNE